MGYAAWLVGPVLAVCLASIPTASAGPFGNCSGPGMDRFYIHDVSQGTAWNDPWTGLNTFFPVLPLGGTTWQGVLVWDGLCGQGGDIGECLKDPFQCITE